MSNQQNTSDNVQGTTTKRSRNIDRKRPGSERQNEDLGEDENQPPNNSDENNTNIPRGRGGFRRGRGRGRFSRALPFVGGYHQGYANYMNGPGGYYGPPASFYGPQYYGADDLYEQEGINNYPKRGNRSSRGGRGRGGTTKNENNDQPQGDDNNTNIRRNSKRRQRKRNDKSSGTEQQTDGAVTDDQQQDKSATRQRRRRSDRRQRRNTNASQSGAENGERIKSDQPEKPKDDETIIKNLVRNMVSKVARRLAPRNRQRSGTNTKEAANVDQAQVRGARRGGRGRPGNDYFIEQGYYDPYGMVPYYYGMYYGYGGGRGRGRGGRGRGRFRQRGASNKENQPQNKIEELNKNDEKSENKTAITERVNQS